MDQHALQPGYMLAEYQIDKLIGEGGFGLTYLATDTHLDKKVAIKEYMPSDFAWRQGGTTIVPKNDAARENYDWGLDSFINEAKTLAKFDVPNIVRIHRFFEDNGTAYLIMEYCEGGSLSDLLELSKKEQEGESKKFMPEVQVRNIIGSIINGLQQVHDRNILHRDIKPDNIMFRKDMTPVLIDFGAARQAFYDKTGRMTCILTPGYAPLEQHSERGRFGPWTDIYALAVVAYICLTGKRPDMAIDRNVQDEIEVLANRPNASAFLICIDWALSVEASDRPQSLFDWQTAWDEPISRYELENSPNVQDYPIVNSTIDNSVMQLNQPNTTTFSPAKKISNTSRKLTAWKWLAISCAFLVLGAGIYLVNEQKSYNEPLIDSQEKSQITDKNTAPERLNQSTSNLTAMSTKVVGSTPVQPIVKDKEPEQPTVQTNSDLSPTLALGIKDKLVIIEAESIPDQETNPLSYSPVKGNSQTVENGTIEPQYPGARLVIGSDALIGKVKLAKTRVRDRGKLKRGDVMIENLTNADLNLLYRFDWLDDEGFSVGEAGIWQPFTLSARDTRSFWSMGKHRDASKMHFIVKYIGN
ncbi:MAG: serine/threonine protein kinase [Phenylobacterium sp.]|jgi:serine/threonine protein kinase